MSFTRSALFAALVATVVFGCRRDERRELERETPGAPKPTEPGTMGEPGTTGEPGMYGTEREDQPSPPPPAESEPPPAQPQEPGMQPGTQPGTQPGAGPTGSMEGESPSGDLPPGGDAGAGQQQQARPGADRTRSPSPPRGTSEPGMEPETEGTGGQEMDPDR